MGQQLSPLSVLVIYSPPQGPPLASAWNSLAPASNLSSNDRTTNSDMADLLVAHSVTVSLAMEIFLWRHPTLLAKNQPNNFALAVMAALKVKAIFAGSTSPLEWQHPISLIESQRT